MVPPHQRCSCCSWMARIVGLLTPGWYVVEHQSTSKEVATAFDEFMLLPSG